jgi:hypothetical protein
MATWKNNPMFRWNNSNEGTNVEFIKEVIWCGYEVVKGIEWGSNTMFQLKSYLWNQIMYKLQRKRFSFSDFIF